MISMWRKKLIITAKQKIKYNMQIGSHHAQRDKIKGLKYVKYTYITLINSFNSK